MGHTATPWHVGPHYKYDIESPSGYVGSLPMTPKGIANAAFIVRAVNCHADLLAALDLANELLDNSEVRHYIGHDLGEMSQLHKALNTARTAIANAKEGL